MLATCQKLKLRVPVFVLLCGVSWIIERGNFLCAGYASKIKVKGTSVCIVMWCKLDHRTRQFLMCWLHVYAWLRVKIKVKGTSVHIVLSCKLDHRTRQFLMFWLRVYASKLRLSIPVFVLFCGVGWIMERGNFFCASYASTRQLNSTDSIVFGGVQSWNLDHTTREFVMSLATRGYARLRFKIKGNFTSVRSWSSDQRTRQFLLAIFFFSAVLQKL